MYEAGERNDEDVTLVPCVVDNEDGNSGVYDNSGYTDYSQTDFHKRKMFYLKQNSISER